MLHLEKLITYFYIGKKYSFQLKDSVIASLKSSFNATGMNFSRNPNESFNGNSPMEKRLTFPFKFLKGQIKTSIHRELFKKNAHLYL